MNRRVPGSFSVMVFFIVLSACLLMAGWYRQFTLIFGAHMKSVIIIITQIAFCLIAGSWIFGRIADRVKNPHILFAGASGTASLIVFFQKPLGNFLLDLLSDSFITPLLLMFVPLSVIAGSIPLLVRYSIRSINHAGIFMSRTLFSASVAVISSVLLSVIIIIPLSGIQALFFTGGVSLFLAVLITLIQFIKHKGNYVQSTAGIVAKATRMRFRKKRIALETGAKLTRAMLYGSVFQAFSFASMLLIYIRILIKFNHLNPVFFYASVLIIVFAGLAAGSLLYGIIADRPANKYLTLAILQILAGITGILSFGLHRFLSPDLLTEIHDSTSSANLIFRHMLLNSLIAFTPSVIHGMSLPLAGRLYPKRLQHIGKTFGHLSALIFAGLLAGVMVTALILIPLIGTHAGLIFLCFLIVLSGVYLIARDSRLIRAFRLTFVLSALLVFIMIIAALRILNVSQINRVSDGIYEGSTLSAHYVTHADSTKSVYVNGDYYFGTGPESLKEQILAAGITLSLRPQFDNALFIGFNTGITASVFNNNGIAEIDIVDESPELIRLSSAAFSDENEDILTESAVQVSVSDPRFLLLQNPRNYSIIYSGSEQVLLNPSRYTVDFLRICRNRLSEEGMYCQVLPYNRVDTTTLLTYLENAREVFRYSSVWYLSEGRILVVASQSELIPEYCRLSEVMEKMRYPWLEKISVKQPENILAHFLINDYNFESISLPANSDDHPQLEFRHTSIEIQHNDFFNPSEYAGNQAPLKASDSCIVPVGYILQKTLEINRSLLHGTFPSSMTEQHVTDSLTLN